jgi:hypothetical protein
LRIVLLSQGLGNPAAHMKKAPDRAGALPRALTSSDVVYWEVPPTEAPPDEPPPDELPPPVDELPLRPSPLC